MKELICIVCPNGCHLKVDEKTLSVTGNSCERGVEYAKSEMTHPTRVITSIVKMADGRVCSVKTSGAILKDKIFEALDLLKSVRLSGEVKIGDVIVPNIVGTEFAWVATKNMKEN